LENIIKSHEVTIHSLEHTVGDLKGKLALLASENERINKILAERLREIDTLRVRIHELEGIVKTHEVTIQSLEHTIGDLKGKLALLSSENERLNSILAERLREIDVLRVRVHELEGQVRSYEVLINELKGKLSLLASENERLNLLVAEKLRIIQEWEQKYLVLENLYLSIKETTEQLGLIKSRYDQAVEISERHEPMLRASHDAKVGRKTIVTESTTLRQSQARTEGPMSSTIRNF